MSDKLPSKTAKEIIKIIESNGFIKVRQSGSHAIFRDSNNRRVAIPIHSNKTLEKVYCGK